MSQNINFTVSQLWNCGNDGVLGELFRFPEPWWRLGKTTKGAMQMNLKLASLILATVAAGGATRAATSITVDSVAQRWPWNNT